MLRKNIMKLEDYKRNIFSSKIDYVYIDVDGIDSIEVNTSSIKIYITSGAINLVRKTTHNIKALKHFGLIGDYFE